MLPLSRFFPIPALRAVGDRSNRQPAEEAETSTNGSKRHFQTIPDLQF
jgi:hypothetical protein